MCGLPRWTALTSRPLERLIRLRALASAVANADETWVPMLKPGHGKATAGYITEYADDADHPFLFYGLSILARMKARFDKVRPTLCLTSKLAVSYGRAAPLSSDGAQ
jgi:hypothetical protein